jgi:cobalt transporter subunit CbtB
MNNPSITTTSTPSVASIHTRTEALVAALVACALGAAIVFTVGFAGAETLHNSAHDSRHSLGFPCH